MKASEKNGARRVFHHNIAIIAEIQRPPLVRTDRGGCCAIRQRGYRVAAIDLFLYSWAASRKLTAPQTAMMPMPVQNEALKSPSA